MATTLRIIGPVTVERCWGCARSGLKPVQRVEWESANGTHAQWLCRHCLTEKRNELRMADLLAEQAGRRATEVGCAS